MMPLVGESRGLGGWPEMTSEIALLNRSALALAADSAVTVRYWEHGTQQTRYTKGANKLFHLSAEHPVGLMTYASAHCQGVPWELLAKNYRDQNAGYDPCGTLDEYAASFFKFVSEHTVFSKEIREKQFVSDVRGVAGRIVRFVTSRPDYDEAESVEAKQKAVTAAMDQIEKETHETPFVGNATEEDSTAALAAHHDAMEKMLCEDTFYSGVVSVVDMRRLAQLAILGLFREVITTLDESGIVIAGFGDNEFFPRLRAFLCFGFVLDKLLYKEAAEKRSDISQEETSEIVAFAQDEMINTFINGVSMSGLQEIEKGFIKSVDFLEDQLRKEIPLDAGTDLEKYKTRAKEQFARDVLGYFEVVKWTPSAGPRCPVC